MMNAPQRDVRICFVGDSFVNGTGDETFLGWTGRVCAALLDDSFSLTHYNLGVRRNTSADILQRWQDECDQRLPDFCEGRIVLSCGINDMVLESGRTRVSMADSTANVRSILEAAKGKYRTLMVGPAAVGEDALNTRIAALNQEYQQVAANLDIIFVDIFQHLIIDTGYLAESRIHDGYHPRSKGYMQITHIVLPTMHDWLS